MEAKDRENINLSSFLRPGYIPPGVYLMTVTVNRQQLSEQNIAFYPFGGDESNSQPCLTDKDLAGFAIKPELIGKLKWWHQGQCLDAASIAGMVNDDGRVYLSGIRAGETMSVEWGDGVKCHVQLPSQLSQQLLFELSLLCHPQHSWKPQRS